MTRCPPHTTDTVTLDAAQPDLPPDEAAEATPRIEAIQRLKARRNAVILAHNYMAPAIYRHVADITGDSLALARRAAESDADVIVMAGVHFMAETAKLLNPERPVLMPDTNAGCSLAESITPADVRALRAQYPGVPVVTYVNTSAAVKAETDVCCTSGNAETVVEALDSDRVIFLPDRFLAAHVAGRVSKEVIRWEGRCEVHDRFTGPQIRGYRAAFDDLTVLAHPECPPDVLAEADCVGSTAQMIDYVHRERPVRALMVTECSMSDNVAAEARDTEFLRPCTLCPHMKRITLDNIEAALTNMEPTVEVDPAVAEGARAAVDRMLAIGR